MRKKTLIATLLVATGLIWSCQNSGLTIVNDSTNPETEYIFVSTVPVLKCENGEFLPESISKEEIVFNGYIFKNCVLEFKAGESPIFSSKEVFNATTGTTLKLDSNLNLEKVIGNFSVSQELTDTNSNGLADELEPKEKFDKLVIVVLEGDYLGPNSTLTPYLKQNYQKLHEGIESYKQDKVKFVVIWDGGRENGVDGNSDLVIIDPKMDLKELGIRITNLLVQGYVSSEDAKAGVIYWNFSSDNLSNHLKELIEVATKAFPAKKYDLIISDHGDGWLSEPTPTVRTVLYESTQGQLGEGTTWLGTKQFAQVLKELKEKGIEFDLIGFDECLMGELVSLSAVAPYANVLIASPNYEPGMGWGDEVWYNLPKWYGEETDTLSIAKKIVNGFIDYYQNNYYSSTVVTLTAVTSKAILELKNSFEEFAYGLSQTAQNEALSGRLFEAFLWDFAYGYYDTYYKTMWISPQVFNYHWNDQYMQELTEPIKELINQGAFFEGYGDFCANSDTSLGADLLYLVAGTGATARVYQLGYSVYDFPTDYTIDGEPIKPSFYYGIIDKAVNFVKTYNTLKSTGEIYTAYLGIDNGYTYPVTGSGLAITYPYTSPQNDEEPKLSYKTYGNFLNFYQEEFPDYSEFIKVVFREYQKALF